MRREIRREKKPPTGSIKKKISCLFGILALLCLLYCLAIALFMGYGTSFFLIWGGLAAGCGLLALLLSREEWLGRIPRWLRRGFCICCMVGGALFLIIEGMILGQFGVKAAPGADYCVVLGAQWKENGPSYVLKKRLDAAVEYLEDNPTAQVIVTGGQGSNEPITEAEGMYGYLVEAGIAPERIRKEEQAVNTSQNLKFSSRFLDKEKDRVVLVTNNFHMFRARGIALRQGYQQVEGLAAGSCPGMLPNNLLREFFGVVKDFLVGNL